MTGWCAAKWLSAHESPSMVPKTPARALRLLCDGRASGLSATENGSARSSETSRVIIGPLQNGVNCFVYLGWVFWNEFDGFPKICQFALGIETKTFKSTDALLIWFFLMDPATIMISNLILYNRIVTTLDTSTSSRAAHLPGIFIALFASSRHLRHDWEVDLSSRQCSMLEGSPKEGGADLCVRKAPIW